MTTIWEAVDIAHTSISALCRTLGRVERPQSEIRELFAEVKTTGEVLESLKDATSGTVSSFDLTALELPLNHCIRTCEQLDKELLEQMSVSGRSDAVTRDPTKLYYKKVDLIHARQSIARHRSILCIVLTDTTLSRSVSSQSIGSYTTLANKTREDLQKQLRILRSPSRERPTMNTEVEMDRMERKSVAIGIDICIQFLKRLAALPGIGHQTPGSESSDDEPSPRTASAGELGSDIHNKAVGDAIQFMLSNNEKSFKGKNEGLGWRTRQAGGHMNDESIQAIVRAWSDAHIFDSGARQTDNACAYGKVSAVGSASSFTGTGVQLGQARDH